MEKIKDYSLYLVISEEYGLGRSALEIAEASIRGGVDIVQMRQKKMPRENLSGLGRNLSELCKEKGVTFIVNDDPLLARDTGASGLHLGQEDFADYTTKSLRAILGKAILGISTHSLSEFKKANDDDFDYISFGPIFPTKTKDYFIGLGEVKDVLSIAKKPVVFIGGINRDNIDDILAEGVKNIALIRAIIEAPDITAETRFFKQRLEKERAKQ